VQQLDGEFAICLIDFAQNKIVIATDTFACKPVWYEFVNGQFGVASYQSQLLGLGFVNNIAEYMVAADVLVSKAGPGTIAEAAALSLPIMLTSYLPGQEEGNVDYVVEAGFGAFCHDSDPLGIAEEVCMWLADDHKRSLLSRAAQAKGAPYAAQIIAKEIGEATLQWREKNKLAMAAKETSEAKS
jgi:glycosyltransferase involved in cell wall biosynthesis